MVRSRAAGGPENLFDRQALALIGVIFLTEAAIAVIFFSLVPQYPVHLLNLNNAYRGRHADLLRVAAAYSGYALSAYGFAKLPGQPIAGWLADRFGSRRVLLAGVLLGLAVIVLMERVGAIGIFIAACALFGLTIAVVWPAIFAIIGDVYAESIRGRILAAINGAQLGGSAIGFAVGAFVIDYTSYTVAFGLVFVLVLLALVLGFILIRSPARPRDSQTAAQPSPAAGFAGLRALLSPGLIILSCILVLISVATTVLAPDLKAYSGGVLHLRFSTFALLLGIPAAVAVLTLFPSGLIADKLGRTLPMLVAVIVWPVSVLLLSFTRSVPLVVLLGSVAAFSYALGLPAWSASLVDLSSSGSRGLQTGAASALQAIGLAIGPAAGGALIARFGPLSPFRLSAALMVLAALLTLLYRANTRRLYAGDRARPGGGDGQPAGRRERDPGA